MTEFTLDESELYCFSLEFSDIYIGASGNSAFAEEINGDDDSENIILRMDGKTLFEDSLELFGTDLLSLQQFNEFLRIAGGLDENTK
jgi:hypothetical protein